MGAGHSSARAGRPRRGARVGAALATLVVAGASAATIAVAVEDDTILVSRATGAAGAKGNAVSLDASISADGRYVAFESDAATLDPADTDATRDVFVRDVVDDTTTLVSRATGATGTKGNAASSAASISADGRYVAFTSEARLHADDSDFNSDVYRRDLQTNETLLVSRTSAGVKGNADSLAPAISADGRYVAFESSAKLVTPDDGDSIPDVYVRDLLMSTTVLVSRASGAAGADANGFSHLPSISANGQVVSFESEASNLTPPDDADTTRDVFVRNLATDTTTLVSRATGAAGVKGNSASLRSAISDDGRWVAFDSQANTLDPLDPTGTGADVYVRDLQTSATTIVSRAGGAGAKGNAASLRPAISADGRYVAFDSLATNLFADDGLGKRGVFVRDLQTLATLLVGRAGGEDGAKANGDSLRAAISDDGRYVAFDSLATNIEPGDLDVIGDVFARDVLGPPDVDPPVITVPANITAPATAPSGAVVDYTATALDNVAVETFACVPPSGSTFPIGTTTVTCTATDTSDNTSMQTFTITVADSTPPQIAVPASIATAATDASGAAVSYEASASDDIALATFGCVPASGSTFEVGTTTVTCSAVDGAGNSASATFTVTVTPLPGASPPPPPPPATDAATKSTAKLSLKRATIDRGSRMLDVLAPISARASGSVDVELRGAGRRLRFAAPIDAAYARIRFRKKIAAAQAAQGSGILTITYAGDDDTRPQTVRLRAASRPAALKPTRPTLSDGHLRASGTVARGARGVVRVQLEYAYLGTTKTLSFKAPIANGAFKLDATLAADVLAEIAARTGTVHSYTLFTGYQPNDIRGEMSSAQVLGDP